MEELVERIQKGEAYALAQGITLVESQKPQDRKKAASLIAALKKPQDPGLRIGITGPPGAGKSTLIEALGQTIRKSRPKSPLGILTVDPSSQLSGGSIQADRLRMPVLSQDPMVFIRPSPSLGAFGGVTPRTGAVLELMERAGYPILIVESVGVGQSEHHLASLVDVLVLVQFPHGGDGWQAIKKGILEVSSLIWINKADGPMKALAFEARDHLLQEQTTVLVGSAQTGEGIGDLWDGILSAFKDGAHLLEQKRKSRLAFELSYEIQSQWEEIQKTTYGDLFETYLGEVEGQGLDIWEAGKAFWDGVLSGKNPSS
jgi:LAO/AO transport system kinase